MSNIVIVDLDGDYYKNVGAYTFVEPDRATRFEPGVTVKVRTNPWIEGQPVLEKQEDPMAAAAKVK